MSDEEASSVSKNSWPWWESYSWSLRMNTEPNQCIREERRWGWRGEGTLVQERGTSSGKKPTIQRNPEEVILSEKEGMGMPERLEVRTNAQTWVCFGVGLPSSITSSGSMFSIWIFRSVVILPIRENSIFPNVSPFVHPRSLEDSSPLISISLFM